MPFSWDEKSIQRLSIRMRSMRHTEITSLLSAGRASHCSRGINPHVRPIFCKKCTLPACFVVSLKHDRRAHVEAGEAPLAVYLNELDIEVRMTVLELPGLRV